MEEFNLNMYLYRVHQTEDGKMEIACTETKGKRVGELFLVYLLPDGTMSICTVGMLNCYYPAARNVIVSLERNDEAVMDEVKQQLGIKIGKYKREIEELERLQSNIRMVV